MSIINFFAIFVEEGRNILVQWILLVLQIGWNLGPLVYQLHQMGGINLVGSFLIPSDQIVGQVLQTFLYEILPLSGQFLRIVSLDRACVVNGVPSSASFTLLFGGVKGCEVDVESLVV